MNEFEFNGFNTKPEESQTVEKAENNSFLDLVDWDDCSDNKLLKKAKKLQSFPKKTIKKLKNFLQNRKF